MKRFGDKIKNLRALKGLTQEEVCGDQTELSVRQLARIEAGKSVPTLNKVLYISQTLGVSVGELADNNFYDLPSRYKELKNMLLRIPTYGDNERIKKRESYIDEILLKFYTSLPEEEKLIVDCLQSKFDVHFSANVNFGEEILNDYFDQVQRKKVYQINDLLLIELYLTCFASSESYEGIYTIERYDSLLSCLLSQKKLSTEIYFTLNNILLSHVDVAFKLEKKNFIERIIAKSNAIMTDIHDFQKRPILSLVEWKYFIYFEKNWSKAETAYQQAILFADLIGDSYLQEKLKVEWKNEST